MGRAPISNWLLERQITVRDVRARVAELGLDVDEFIADVWGDREEGRDVLLPLGLVFGKVDESDASPGWKTFTQQVRGGEKGWLAGDWNPRWKDFVREARGQGYDHVLQPAGVRTLRTEVRKVGWDHRRMPSDVDGFEGTLAGLIETVQHLVLETVGGEEFIYPETDECAAARSITVLATTMAAVLTDDSASITDPRLHERVLRADIYERAVTGAGLGTYFQIIRRLLELDHPDHVRVLQSGVELDFGFIECRGRTTQYLAINAQAAKRWLDPKRLPP